MCAQHPTRKRSEVCACVCMCTRGNSFFLMKTIMAAKAAYQGFVFFADALADQERATLVAVCVCVSVRECQSLFP